MSQTAGNPVSRMEVNQFFRFRQNGGFENGMYMPGSVAGAYKDQTTELKQQEAEELDNCSDESVVENRQRRPNCVKNGHMNKLKFDNCLTQTTNADGSLPSSPDSPSDCMEFTVGYIRLDHETRELILLFFRIYCGLSAPGRSKSKSKALPTLTRVVNDVIEKHQIAYNGMVNRLAIDQKGDDMSFVAMVAENLFSDGTTNWGRIASLVAFGATVCKHLKDNGREGCVEMVADQISSYLLTHKKDWLFNNKGWEGFVEFFHVEDPECVVRNALMAFASVAGIGAGLALLMR